MKSLIVASTREGAGKTSLAVGLSQSLGKKLGFLKPLGDRPLYQKKRLWDRDASLFSGLLELEVEPENLSLGFDHSKLRYMYDQDSVFDALQERISAAGVEREAVLIECGKDLSYGASVFLDPLTISQRTGFPVLIVAGGSNEAIADDLAFVQRFVGTDEANVAGVVFNKVEHVDDFRAVHLPEIEKTGIEILGLIPRCSDLETRLVSTIADRLFARVLTGETGLHHAVHSVFVGAMSVDAAMSAPLIAQPEKLLITSGDRSDMIIAAIDAGGTSAIVLTNNIVPPASVIAHAGAAGIPLLLVPGDTYAVALQVERIEAILTLADDAKMATLRELCVEHVDVRAIGRLL